MENGTVGVMEKCPPWIIVGDSVTFFEVAGVERTHPIFVQDPRKHGRRVEVRNAVALDCRR